MPPLRRVVADYRAPLIVLSVMGLIALGAYGLFVYPLRARVAGVERRALAAADTLRAASQQQLAARALVSGKDQAARDLERFYDEVLPGDRATARHVAYVRLAELAEESNLRSTRRSVAVERDRDGRLARMDVSMTLRGNYSDIRQFIHKIETSRDFVVIKGVELAQRETGDGRLEVALELATFYKVPDGE